jgi:hypothetical protein
VVSGARDRQAHVRALFADFALQCTAPVDRVGASADLRGQLVESLQRFDVRNGGMGIDKPH